MKINAIGVRPNYQQLNTSTKEVKETKTNVNREFVYGSYNIYPAFTGGNASKLAIFKNATTLHCPYCGVKMLHIKDFNRLDFSPALSAEFVIGKLRSKTDKLSHPERHFLNKLEAADYHQSGKSFDDLMKGITDYKPLPAFEEFRGREFSPKEYTKTLIDRLQKFEDNMRPIQKKVFEKLKMLNDKYPGKTFEEFMAVMRPESLKSLHAVEIGILNRISGAAGSLSKNSAQELTKIINQSRKIIQGNNIEPFKRKVFLSQIAEFMRTANKNEDFSKIYQLASTMPTSANNLDAFIVKYSGKVPRLDNNRTVYENRSSREIAQSLIFPSTMTLEHVIPQAELARIPERTPIRNANYLPTCSPCNNEKGSIPLADMLKQKPEMKVNIQRFMQDVTQGVNEGKVIDINYPDDIAKTIVAESGGAIKPEDIDLSKLDLQGASAKIALQEARFAARFSR